MKDNPKILHITLKKKWFDMILSGEKKEEYREVKDYWIKRLVDTSLSDPKAFKDFDIVRATNGYQKDARQIDWIHEGIEIHEPLGKWSDNSKGNHFCLQIGEIIAKRNIPSHPSN